jgi:hypothetical protein
LPLELGQNVQGSKVPQCATAGSEPKPPDSAAEVGNPEAIRVMAKGAGTNRQGSGWQGVFLEIRMTSKLSIKFIVCNYINSICF